MSKVLSYSECVEYVSNTQDYMESPGVVGVRDTHVAGDCDLYFSKRGWCPFCGRAGVRVHEESEFDSRETSISESAFILENDWLAWQCEECGWWDLLYKGRRIDEIEGTHLRTVIRSGVLKVFETSRADLPVDVLRKAMARHPSLMNEILPRKMEELVRSVFADFYHCEVVHCGGPNDGGFDLIAVLSDHPLVIQVKRRADPLKAESVSTVVHLVGSMMFADQRHGIVVTTAGRYSKMARSKATVAVTKNLVDSIDLIDAGRFLDMLAVTASEIAPHWRRFLPRNKQKFVNCCDPS